MTISSIDREARVRSIDIMKEKFTKLVKNIIENREPVLIIPKRTLSNTIYDEKNKLLLLGPEMLKRKFIDVNETRKFMQTMLMASIIYSALANDEYPTIRDLYYRGKHSIKFVDLENRVQYENTWDEQVESDSVIRDLEVYLNLLREDLLILSKEKGKVVGNLVIKSGDDTIDLSKMGHGAYAIEPTPDLIEFKDVDAEYVLVIEKDAVFQQLHRYGYWKKNRAILVTSAGQPDRATRRFVRRLNEELKLPVYVLCDSDPYGFYIYSVFKIGSITLSYESNRLATPNAKFIGVMMTDVFGSEIFNKIVEENPFENISVKAFSKLPSKKPYLSESERRNFIIKAKMRDIERAVELVGFDIAEACLDDREAKNIARKKSNLAGYPWFRTPEWIRETCIFFKTLSKLEIEALTGKSLKFLAEEYIPVKIETGDFID
ncbi:MAG: DNA topoisomerase IV subunit A [Desulfurococcaceae archaeon]|uniref:Type 2 DNA topoisomerase 6 subunit A n=1 Tax=Staphylothermus marinus TaxID=2280 RepID=A0A7C4JMK0_STAMA